MSDAAQFSLDISNWATKLVPAQFVAMQSKLTMDGLDGVIMLSRVDTGHMRNNHQVGVNSTSPTEYPAGAESDAARRDAEAALAALKLGDTTFIFCPVEYVYYNEFGTPKMAPAPMYRPTLERLKAMLA